MEWVAYGDWGMLENIQDIHKKAENHLEIWYAHNLEDSDYQCYTL